VGVSYIVISFYFSLPIQSSSSLVPHEDLVAPCTPWLALQAGVFFPCEDSWFALFGFPRPWAKRAFDLFVLRGPHFATQVKVNPLPYQITRGLSSLSVLLCGGLCVPSLMFFFVFFIGVLCVQDLLCARPVDSFFA